MVATGWLILFLSACGRVGYGAETPSAGDSAPALPVDGGMVVSAPVQLARGYQHTCVVAGSGSLYCFGRNDNGQLGLGTASAVNLPMRVDGILVRAADGGFTHTCAIALDGSLHCWGSDTNGQLGLGSTLPGATRAAPAAVALGSSWSEVSAGHSHTCAIRVDGTLWCWGRNGARQLGVGDSTDRPSPTQVLIVAPEVGPDDQWAVVSAGDDHTCAIQVDGSLWCWGSNGNGQLGRSETVIRERPGRVGMRNDWSRVSLGRDTSCAVDSAGAAWCWGRNDVGQLGVGDLLDRATPTAVSLPATASFAFGVACGCALTLDGTVYAFGDNEWGALGTLPLPVSSATPIEIPFPPGVEPAAIAAGNGGCCATTDDEVWCWGRNDSGETGGGDTVHHPTPVRAALP